MDESLLKYVIPSALSFVGGYLLRYVEPRSRLVHWFPAYFAFQVPFTGAGGTQQVGAVSTHALSIQNVGWRSARRVEIIHRQRPQFFQIQPAVNFTEATNPSGEHVIIVQSLARREFITIQILSTGTIPGLVGVKSEDGPAQQVTTQQQFVISRRRQAVFALFLIVGFVATIYWVGKVGLRLLGLFLRLAM